MSLKDGDSITLSKDSYTIELGNGVKVEMSYAGIQLGKDVFNPAVLGETLKGIKEEENTELLTLMGMISALNVPVLIPPTEIADTIAKLTAIRAKFDNFLAD